jgi:hypothetical protein
LKLKAGRFLLHLERTVGEVKPGERVVFVLKGVKVLKDGGPSRG